MRSSALFNFSASTLSMRERIASVVGRSFAASEKFRFNTMVLRARSSASNRKCSGSGRAAPSKSPRVQALTVCGSARLAMSSYSASVTFVLIDRVRRVAMRLHPSENRAKVARAGGDCVSGVVSRSSFFATIGCSLKTTKRFRSGKLRVRREFRIRSGSSCPAARWGVTCQPNSRCKKAAPAPQVGGKR